MDKVGAVFNVASTIWSGGCLAQSSAGWAPNFGDKILGATALATAAMFATDGAKDWRHRCRTCHRWVAGRRQHQMLACSYS